MKSWTSFWHLSEVDKRYTKIILWVTCAHIAVIGIILWQGNAMKPMRTKTMQVTTLSLPNQKRHNQTSSDQSSTNRSSVRSVTATESNANAKIEDHKKEPTSVKNTKAPPPKVAQKTNALPQAKETTIKKQGPQIDIQAQRKKSEILKIFEKSRHTIEQTPTSSSEISSIIKEIEMPKGAVLSSLHIETEQKNSGSGENCAQMQYRQTIGTILQEQLHPPEEDNFKIHVTVACDGKILSWNIVECQSLKNKLYLHKILPQLQFPSFESAFPGENERTFPITRAN